MFPIARLIIDSDMTRGNFEHMNQLRFPDDVIVMEGSCGWDLNDNQLAAFELTTMHRIALIQGPPGTGKTQLARSIQRAHHLHASAKIIICAPSNNAVDCLASAALEFCDGDSNRFVRLGNVDNDKISSIFEDVLFEKWCTQDNKQSFCKRNLPNVDVVAGTLTLFGNEILETTDPFVHLVIMDEAAQAMECESICPLNLLTEDSRIVLIGDPKQLPPQTDSKYARNLGIE